MPTDQLKKLAQQHGIVECFTDNFGHQQKTETDVSRAILQAIGALGADATAVTRPLQCVVVTLGEPAEFHIDSDPASRLVDDPAVERSTQSIPDQSGDCCEEICSYVIESEQGSLFQGKARLCAVPAGNTGMRVSLQLPVELPGGYHHLQLAACPPNLREQLSVLLIVVPDKAFKVDSSNKPVGVSVQLYSLRSQNNWGIGDFSDLGELCALLAEFGVDTIGVNPLHALYTQHPERCSPYSPSSRVFLNPLYIDVMAVPGVAGSQCLQQWMQSEDFLNRLQRVRGSTRVEYPHVAGLKLRALRLLFDSCYAPPGLARVTGTKDSDPGLKQGPQQRFAEFVARQGEALQLHARFEAFDRYFSREQNLSSWIDWPTDYQDPSTPQCRALALQLVNEIAFSCFLQWVADGQLAAVAQAAKTSGLRHGLYMDLAVGVDHQGGEVWARPQQFARGIHIGAPPDALGPLGQDWSLTPYNPVALQDSSYAAFVAVLRANMRYAGILRIDHVMGLVRQYWCVPSLRRESGLAPGAYINFPLDDLLGLVVLESQRNHCVVVGEDLGTVPAGFRDKLEQRGIHGYRVLYFEKDDNGGFRHPRHYETGTLATASTHDLPTLAGFLNRRDITVRMSLGHIEPGEPSSAWLSHRRQELSSLLELLALPDNATGQWLQHHDVPGGNSDASVPKPHSFASALEPAVEALPATSEFVSSVHRLLAQAGSAILVLQLEDLLQQLDMANLPGTIDEHPNWQRKLPLAIESLREHLGHEKTLLEVVQLRKAG